MAGLHFDITGDNSNFIRKLHECENGVRNTSKQIEQSGLSIEDLFNRMTKAAAAFGAGFTAKELISNIAQVRGEFQQLEVAFKTMLGSEEKANALMQQLVKTAATTPFDLQGVANGAKQLLAYGENVENVNDDLIRLGNIAAGLSQPLGDIVYLYGTTMTQGRLYTQDLNQFTGRGIPMIRELAKQFNVAENEVKGLVEAGKVGFPEVQKVIMSLTNEGGMFYNLMQEQSKTITGQISNIEDAIATMFNEIGKANEGIINDALSGVSYLVENYEKVGRVLLEIVGTYGAYRTALMVTSSLQALQASGITALTTKEAVHYGWLVLTKKAQDALNLSMLKNPYVLAAAAIAGLAYGIYKLATAETETERAVRKTNEALEAQEGYYEGLKNKASELSNILSNESKSIEERFIAYRQLQRLMPEVFQNMDWETAKRKTNAELIKLETDELLRRQRIGLKTKVVMSQQKIQGLENSIIKTDNRGGYTGALKEDLSAARKELEIYTKALDDFEKADEQAKKDADKPTVYNKKYWEGKKKEAEDARAALDSSKENSKEWNKYTKQIQEAQKQIDKYSDSKTAKEYNSIVNQQKKISELLDKQATERKRKEQDLENQLTQSRIDAMAEGEAKIRAQRELDNKKEIQDLERQREDYIRTEIELQRKAFDEQESLREKQTNNYKKKTFDASSVKVDTSAFDSIIGNIKKRQFRDQISEQEQDWNEYIIKYGTFQQKKEAIARKYNKAIEESATAGEAASLQKEFEEALSNLNLDKLKNTINWQVIFGDLSKITKDQLTKVKAQLNEFKKSSEFKNATPDQIKVIEEAVDNINNALIDKSGFFGGLGDSLTEYEQAVVKVTEAQTELNKALESGDEVAIEKAREKKNAAELNQLNAQVNAEKSRDKAISNINAVADAMTRLSDGSASLSEVGNIVGNLVDAFAESGSKIGGIIGAILSIIDQIGEKGVVGFAGGIVKSLGHVAEKAWGGFANVLTLGKFNIGGADYSDYNEMVEEYNKLNDIWDELIDKKKEYIDMSYGPEAAKAGEEAIEIAKKSIESYKLLGKERLNSGASTGSHSIGVRIRNSMSQELWDQWDEFAKSIGQNPDAIGGRLTGLFDLTAEQLEKLKEEAPGFWSKLDGDVQNYLNKIIEGEERIEDIQKAVQEQLTQTSFDSLFDSFIDTLMDMDASSKDFADNFGEYMRKAIFTQMFSKGYEDELRKWYDSFSAAMGKEGGITSSDIKDLREGWDTIVNGALEDRKAWEQIVGGGGTSTSQESSKKGFATMSQDSADELNGRFTALQIAGEEIKNQMMAVVMGINSLTSISSIGNEVLNNILTQHVITNSYLDDITKYTKLLNDIKADISEVRVNTKGLSTR
ncbi:tape measure protein [Bacteroides faecis]|jgi:tape measure domain-containing protein|uniref:tape measure protein n=1 Tax=Bacteroides faecis TaxID=674529 RepID=UPI001C3FAA45|nr:tape measure protein [Bacteroides faecis]MCS2576365.1 tape measure protein [Bacteroides faecis]MCS3325559.1 tape measure protein [Bacteroides faecis]